MANPRKFSEKIALHNQKQAEETAAFERIMQEVSVTRVIGMPQPSSQRLLNPHPQAFLRPYFGGSLPNVNQMSNPSMELHIRRGGYDDMRHPLRHPTRFDGRMRPYTHRRAPMPQDLQNRHHQIPDGMTGGPHAGPYLSPPTDSSWRSFALSRTNSDSALHQSVMNQNVQDPFNNPAGHMPPMPPPQRRDTMDHMMPHKLFIESEKLHQQLIANNTRPKSCEGSQMNVISNADCHDPNRTGSNAIGPRHGLPPNPTNAPGLSHVTQIGNNTGSLPDLTNLHIPSPLPNPIDYDEQQKQLPPGHQQHGNTLQSPTSMLFQQARSTGNLASASSVNPHLGGLTARGGTPASPNRSRRQTYNGPSPLSLTSPNQNRRMKFPGVTSAKIAGLKGDLKNPVSGTYPYPYPLQMPGVHSPQHSANHQGMMEGRSTVHQQHRQIQQHLQQQQQQHHQQQQGEGSNSNHPALRVDVNAASKVNQYPIQHHQVGQHRHSSGGNHSSPMTSPTSPTSLGSLSPGASPQHLPELTSTSNPALSEAYYRSDVSNMQPLQHQFEHFHVVNDPGSSSSLHHTSIPPPVYSNLQMLAETGFPQATTTLPYGLPNQRSSDSTAHVYNNGNSSLLYKSLVSPSSAKIPDIVFTGVDDPQSSKFFSGSSGDLTVVPGYHTMGITSGVGMSDLGTDYFPGDDLKVNLGLEELQMLEEPNIEDPSLEDNLHL